MPDKTMLKKLSKLLDALDDFAGTIQKKARKVRDRFEDLKGTMEDEEKREEK